MMTDLSLDDLVAGIDADAEQYADRTEEIRAADREPDRVKDARRAYDVLDLIKKHPGALDMGVFSAGNQIKSVIDIRDLITDECGTVACVAGWTAAAAGYHVGHMNAYRNTPAGLVVAGTVAGVAARLLGLDGDELDELFYDTDEDELEDRILQIFGPDPR